MEDADHERLAGLAFGDVLPEFLGDEWHEGVYDVQQFVEDVECGIECGLVDRSLVSRLYHFEIPSGELVCKEFEGCHESLVETVLGVVVVYLGVGGLYLCFHPLDGLVVGCRLLYVGLLPSLYESEGVPHLVAEVHALCAECVVVEDVVAGRSGEHHAHAYAVRAELLDELEGVGRVAE